MEKVITGHLAYACSNYRSLGVYCQANFHGLKFTVSIIGHDALVAYLNDSDVARF